MIINRIVENLMSVTERTEVVEQMYEISQTVKQMLIDFDDTSNDEVLDSFGTIDIELEIVDLYYLSCHSVELDSKKNLINKKIIDDEVHRIIEELTEIKDMFYKTEDK